MLDVFIGIHLSLSGNMANLELQYNYLDRKTPACKGSEISIFGYVSGAIQAGLTLPTESIEVATARGISIGSMTAVHKIYGESERTFLIVQGDAAGFIAADLKSSRHRRYLEDIHNGYGLSSAMIEKAYASGIHAMILRPVMDPQLGSIHAWLVYQLPNLLSDSITDAAKASILNAAQLQRKGWYRRVLVEMLIRNGVDVDKKTFLRNTK